MWAISLPLRREAFLDYDEYLERIDETIDRIKNSKKRPGVEEILVPRRERSARKAAINNAQGIPVPRDDRGDRAVVWALERCIQLS